jgi:hypothetical protein
MTLSCQTNFGIIPYRFKFCNEIENLLNIWWNLKASYPNTGRSDTSEAECRTTKWA